MGDKRPFSQNILLCPASVQAFDMVTFELREHSLLCSDPPGCGALRQLLDSSSLSAKRMLALRAALTF